MKTRAAVAHKAGEPLTIDHTSVKWTGTRTYTLAPGASRYELWESSLASRAGLASLITVSTRLNLASTPYVRVVCASIVLARAD